MKLIACALLFFSAILVLRAQTVEIGPDGITRIPRATESYCASEERLSPNLDLKQSARVRGRISDRSGAPFANSPIILRRFISERRQTAVRKFLSKSDGQFDLGVIKPGEYRLLLAPNRGFRQAENLACVSESCLLNVVLVVNPTDLPTAGCPIR